MWTITAAAMVLLVVANAGPAAASPRSASLVSDSGVSLAEAIEFRKDLRLRG